MVLAQCFDYFITNPKWILAIASFSVIAYVVYRMFSRSKQGESVFTSSNIKPRGPIITNRNAKKKILKQRFKIDQVPTDLDAIVIGSGPGGLSAAVLLSKVGKKVLVLEQHDCAGGTSHMFSEKGYEFDTGVHYLGNMDGTFMRTLTDQLTDGQLQWERMDDEFDVIALVDKSNVRLYPRRTGKENYIQDLTKQFPEEKAAIESFFKLVNECSDTSKGMVILKIVPKWLATIAIKTGVFKMMFPNYMKYITKTLQNVLDELTSNSELKLLLSYIFGDHGVAPERVPFVLHAGMMSYFMDGAFYPCGGTSQIALNMIPIIEKYGGRVLTKAPVTQILVDHWGTAHGVSVSSKLDGNVIIRAPIIISNAGALNTFQSLLPKEIATKSGAYGALDIAGTSISYITVFLGLRGSMEELGVKACNTWAYFHNDINQQVRTMMTLSAEDAIDTPSPFLFICFPSAKDPVWQKENPDKTSGLIITMAKYEWFEAWQSKRKKHRGDDYEDLKDRFGQSLWRQCLRVFPQLEDKLEYFNVGSPVTNRDYLGIPKGGLYGLDQAGLYKPEATINLRWKTDIPGLYITGQDSLTAGFVSALMSGVFCASEILNRKLYVEIEKFHKSLKKTQ